MVALGGGVFARMMIDVPSVIAVSAMVTAVVGLLLVHSWRQCRVPALLLWGTANLLLAAGIVVPLAGRALADGPFIEIANAAVLFGYGLVWAGIRDFDGRPTRLTWAAAGAVLWLIAAQLPAFEHEAAPRAALGFLVCGTYVTAAAFVVARGRAEPLMSRNAAIFLLFIHSVILIGRVPEAAFAHWPDDHVLSRAQLFAAFSLENLLFTVAMAFILLAMVKERLEARQRDKAYTDLLTGIPNRRAFFEAGRERLEEAARSEAPSALVLFDLDRFKEVNDRHGHESGDRTLVAFAEIVRAELRPKDVLARIGGEEFACLLPGLPADEAARVADRIRLALARTRIGGPADPFQVTVSGGIAVASPGDLTLDDLLRAADKALYEAKRGGRDRIEQSAPHLVARDGRPTEAALPRPGSVVRAFRKTA